MALLLWLAAWAWARHDPSGISWHWFADGAGLLTGAGPGTGLHLYAAHPDLQIGPLALGLAAAAGAVLGPLPGSTLDAVQVLMTAALPVCLLLLRPLCPGRGGEWRLLATGVVLAPTWTVLAVRWAHLDDVVATVLLCLAVRAVRQDRAVLAGVALALAAGAKPWAVVGGALLALLPLRRAVRGSVVAVVVLAALWGPFLLAAPGTLAAFRPPVPVGGSSLLALIGYAGDWTPGWVRTAQLLLAPAVALAVVRAGAWPAALLTGLAVRLLLDPQDLAYYAGSATVAAALVDLLGRAPAGRRPWFPTATVLTTAVLWQPFVASYDTRLRTSHGLALWWYQHPHPVAALHLIAALAGLALLLRMLARSRSGVPAPPLPDLDGAGTAVLPGSPAGAALSPGFPAVRLRVTDRA